MAPTTAAPVAAATIERADWQAARKADTADAYRRFSAKHPESRRAIAARDRALLIEANAAYDQIGVGDPSFSVLSAYLDQYPASHQSSAAYNRIRARWERDQIEAEQAEFDRAKAANTAAALASYIERNRLSPHLPAARVALQSLVTDSRFSALKAALARKADEAARPAKEPASTDQVFNLVYFPARTTEPSTHVIYKGAESRYWQIKSGGKPVQLRDDFELIELRGIAPFDTFVLYVSDQDLTNADTFRASLSTLLHPFIVHRCEALGLQPCNNHRLRFDADGLVGVRPRKPVGKDDFLRPVQAEAAKRPAFGTQPNYLPESARATWASSPFLTSYTRRVCSLLNGPPGELRQAAADMLNVIEAPESQRCLLAHVTGASAREPDLPQGARLRESRD